MEYISLYEDMRGVLTFVVLVKEIYFALEIKCDTPKVLCSIFEKQVTVHEENQGVITLAVAPQMLTCTNHIAIKYHHLWSFFANGYVKIKHVDTKEQVADIL